MIEESGYLISPLVYSKTENITKMQKDYINHIVVKQDNAYIYLDVYALFCLTGEDKTPENLVVFEAFYSWAKGIFLSDYRGINIKLAYETGPARLIPFITQKNGDKLIVMADKQAYLQTIIDNNPQFSAWLKFMAINLRKIGRWSWINISYKGLINFNEETKLPEKNQKLEIDCNNKKNLILLNK